jgi:hypothetical protein
MSDPRSDPHRTAWKEIIMTIIPVENTKQIKGESFIGVQAATDAEAEKSLELIAKRRGVAVENVYRWGNGYYYAPIVLGNLA